MMITWQSIITAGAVLGALTAISTLIIKFVRWIDRQKAQDVELKQLKARHAEDNEAIQHELAVLNCGILACLNGLQEQGCNGPVTEAINRIEKHLNQNAHK